MIYPSPYRRPTNRYPRIGWMFLILVGGFKLVESAFGADWIRLADYRLIMMLALAVLHVLIGWVKARREEDRYRARFL